MILLFAAAAGAVIVVCVHEVLHSQFREEQHRQHNTSNSIYCVIPIRWDMQSPVTLLDRRRRHHYWRVSVVLIWYIMQKAPRR